MRTNTNNQDTTNRKYFLIENRFDPQGHGVFLSLRACPDPEASGFRRGPNSVIAQITQ